MALAPADPIAEPVLAGNILVGVHDHRAIVAGWAKVLHAAADCLPADVCARREGCPPPPFRGARLPQASSAHPCGVPASSDSIQARTKLPREGRMTTTSPTDRATGEVEAVEERGSGWVTFAGVMIGLVGVLNVIYGIAAIDKSSFYVANARYVFGDLKTWGWVMLIVGAVQLCAAFGIFARVTWARWVGVASAAANMIVQLLLLPQYPLLSLAIFAIDVLVIYGLVAYARRPAV